jgi:hypothetical protein
LLLAYFEDASGVRKEFADGDRLLFVETEELVNGRVVRLKGFRGDGALKA